MPSPARPRDYLVLHAVVLVWGITAILGKCITLGPVALTAWRTGIAGLILFLILWLRKQPMPAPRGMAAMVGTGLLLGLHWYLFFLGARVGSVSGSLAGISTLALWVALLEPVLIRGRRWSWAEGILALGVVLGVVMIQFNDRGLITGILAAAVAALMAIINARLTLHYDAMVITAFEMLGAFLVCSTALAIPALGGAPQVWWPVPGDWLWILLLAVLCTVVVFPVCVWVQRRVSAFSVGMATNLEPIYGMLLAPLVFGAAERQTLRFYQGSAVIIGVVLLHTVLTQRQAARLVARSGIAPAAPP